jgi:DNA-directed RNA polymerase subunit N (RpoN/RPB10)
MLYFKCPTCRTVLANKQLIYEERLAEISNSKKSKEEKDKEKRKLLDDLKLIRECCRMRMMGYVKLIDILK